MAGGLAVVNPCGFPLLPDFLSFYLGADERRLSPAPTRVLQGLLVGALVTVGFLGFFALVGLPVSYGVGAIARVFPFRGGPLDGHSLPVPVTNDPEWSIPTDGVWLGDLSEQLPEDLTNVDYRNESYYPVGDGDDAEYVHPTLLEERPEGWPDWRPL